MEIYKFINNFRFNHTLSTIFIITIFIAIIATQYVYVYDDVGIGIILTLFLVILIYMAISIIKMKKDFIDSAEALALVPLYVMFTSSLPWFFIDQTFLMPAVYSIVLALCFWHIYYKDLKFSEVGLKRGNIKKFIVIGVLIGIFTGIIEYFILLPNPSFPSFELKYFLRDAVYMLFFVGLGEELLFRGIIQNELIRTFGVRWGIIGQGFLFGIMHLTWRSVPELGFTFLAGMLLGYLYHRTGSLTAPIVLHGVNNIVLVAVLPYILLK
jgi:membrane protease YdiL (CAAX protease family)